MYFASFYFRVWDLTREIRENKNPAKISTYTVYGSVAGMRSKKMAIIKSDDNKPCTIKFEVIKHNFNCDIDVIINSE